MTFSKEQISQAFTEVLNDRVPDLSNIPDHTFSERFEKNMNRLIKKEAAHPWAVSHTLARNLIAAALVIVLLFAMCMSVGAIRNKIFNFFLQHFDDHDKIIFEMPEEIKIEQDYLITNLPEGFSLKEEEISEIYIRRNYENAEDSYITLSQEISLSNGIALDNERSEYTVMEIDGRGVFISIMPINNSVTCTWNQDNYVFLLVLSWENVTVDDAITVFRSIQPAD